MPFVDAFPITTTIENASSASEKKILVDFEKLLFPEVIFVENIGAEDLSCYTTSQVFKTFASEASLDRSIILNSISVDTRIAQVELLTPWAFAYAFSSKGSHVSLGSSHWAKYRAPEPVLPCQQLH